MHTTAEAETCQPRETRSSRRFLAVLLAVVCLGLALRVAFPLADPPWFSSVGIVWHDEGAWVHNARNRALTGTWRVDGDQWNPMYITPVLTGLEYLSFRAFGVGLWQARLVSGGMGILSVLLIGLGMARVGGRSAGLAAAALLATNFVYVMYDRAALMEATMVSLVVVSWYCYSRAAASPRWGLAAGAAAVAAYFTKATAVFFLPALAIDAVLTLGLARSRRTTAEASKDDAAARRRVMGAWYTLAGLVGAGLFGLAVFVLPNWDAYRFYNWQMSVTRKPAYTVKAFLDRASWLPVANDLFTRMWPVAALALCAALGTCLHWRRAAPGERVLVLWGLLGTAELVLHDVGNERRLVFLIPVLVALASLAIARDRQLIERHVPHLGLRQALLAAPAVLGGLYFLAGAAVRLRFMDDLHAGVFQGAVRWSAVAALALCCVTYLLWPQLPRLLARVRWTPVGALVIVLALIGSDLWQYAQWAAIRTSKNYDAMVALGHWLPPGTLVHGKLANGLDLENRITPVFVGRGFGNYDDRAARPDIRYLLTYLQPSLGFESQARDPVILDVLAASPGWKIVREFDVAETAGGRDRAALIDKYPGRESESGIPPPVPQSGK
jgi:hypothetical protein